MKRVLIIGGGASGLMAAISAARAGAKVTVLEHNRQVGKKLLATGNGRCNLTNVDQAQKYYRGTHPEFAAAVLGQFGMHETLGLLTELGIFTKNKNGCLYPYSEQASTVADVLRMEAEHQKVKLACNTQIQEVRRTDGGFQIETGGWTYEAEALILATGSKAAPDTGSDGSGYVYAAQFGHRIIKPLPALVQLRSRDKAFQKERLAGVRMDAGIELFADGHKIAWDQGEVQFTRYGISGIPVFQVSRYGSRALEEGSSVEVHLDLMPVFSSEAFADYLLDRARKNAYKTAESMLIGLFPKKMAEVLLERAGIERQSCCRDFDREQAVCLADKGKRFVVPVYAANDFTQAQVCSGGVDTSQVNEATLESYLVPGLYFAGELLDIDGACGGYNLQWAFSSGYVAGCCAGKDKTL